MRPVPAVLAAASSLLAVTTDAAPRELLVPDVGFAITAPSPRGPWTMRVINEGDRPVRIPADLRLIRLDVTAPGARPRRVRCTLPSPLRPSGFPEARALYLEPGQAYDASFDPRLFCFGAREAGALVPGASVRAFYGWPRDPYAVEDLDVPSEIASLRALAAPIVTIGPGPAAAVERAAPERRETATAEVLSEPVPDEKAPRLALEVPRFIEAASPHALVLHARAFNAGARAMTVVLRDRMLRFTIEGPTGPYRCAAPRRVRDATPRPLFGNIAPGRSVPLAARLTEVCGHDVFRRPGLYRITTTLVADERGDLPAYTGEARAEYVTLVRLLSAPEPFHLAPPEAAEAE